MLEGIELKLKVNKDKLNNAKNRLEYITALQNADSHSEDEDEAEEAAIRKTIDNCIRRRAQYKVMHRALSKQGRLIGFEVDMPIIRS